MGAIILGPVRLYKVSWKGYHYIVEAGIEWESERTYNLVFFPVGIARLGFGSLWFFDVTTTEMSSSLTLMPSKKGGFRR